MQAAEFRQQIDQIVRGLRNPELHLAFLQAVKSRDWVATVGALIDIQEDLLSQGRVADPGNQVKASRRLQPVIGDAIRQIAEPAAQEAVIAGIDATLAKGSANQALYLYRGTAATLAGRQDLYEQIFNDRLVRVYDLAQIIQVPDFKAFCDALISELERVVHFRPIGGNCPTSEYSFNMVGADSDTIQLYNTAVQACFSDYSRHCYGDELAFGPGDLEGFTVRLYNGEALAEHIHPTSWLTCASYVRIPPLDTIQENDGIIVFARPNQTARMIPYQTFRPELGKLLIFPAYLPHYTMAVHSGQERVSSNYDVYCKPTGFPPAA